MVDWEIFYYNILCVGRVEFVCLIFEEVGVFYIELMKIYEEIWDMIMNNKFGGFLVMFFFVLKWGRLVYRV